MKIDFCTLFDSFYLDKGLTMYQSLVDTGCDFNLYILAMNDKCYDILKDKKLAGIIPIALEDFMDDDLRRVKAERSRAEFCWTCSSCLLRYILKAYPQVELITYIDADLYFYNNPKVLIDEFLASGKSASIIEHRFDNSRYSAELKKNSGKYCVEFNSFKNNAEGIKVLDDWRKKCIDACSSTADGESFGDQKYQDTWTTDYTCIHETRHLGAGIAPWNISQYRYAGKNQVRMGKEKTPIDIIFYHYHMIDYLPDNMVDINIFTRSGHAEEKLVYGLYSDYLSRIENVRLDLSRNYGIDYTVKASGSSNSNNGSSNWKKYLGPQFFSKVYMKIHYILNKKKDYMRL